MMITGRQIREAREKLGWSPSELALRAQVSQSVIEHAETFDDTPGILLDQSLSIRQVLEKAGIKFGRSVGVDFL